MVNPFREYIFIALVPTCGPIGDSPMAGERPWSGESFPEILELDNVFEALSHPRRRYLLYTLLEDDEWSLWEIAEKIASWESEPQDPPPSADPITDVYISLYHNHIPKLVDADIIAFSETDETLTPGSNATQVLTVLQQAGGTTDSEQESHARGETNEGHI